jgi:hypothetical protein
MDQGAVAGVAAVVLRFGGELGAETLGWTQDVIARAAPVDRSAGQTAPGASRRQCSRRVHRCEGQAPRKLAVIL